MNSQMVSAQVALVVYDDRVQAAHRSAIELWASASTVLKSCRRYEFFANRQKAV